jgi:hypothetical protein
MKRRRHMPEQVEAAGDATGCWRRGRRAGGLEGAGDFGGNVSALAGAVRRDEGRRRQAPQELEAENARLKRIVADQVLEVAALQEIGKGDW